MNPRYLDILLEVGTLPTAPFVEQAVMAYINRFAASRGHLKVRTDRWGNMMVSYSNGRASGPPLWLMAHMDHPGFIAERMVRDDRLLARWLGGVKIEYFPDADLQFFVLAHNAGRPDECRVERIVPGMVRRVVRRKPSPNDRPGAPRRADRVFVEVAEEVPPGSPGMWYLPDSHASGQTIVGRAHDDLGQVAALLCLLDELGRRQVRGQVTCVFTRGEEAGFVGAIALANSGLIPPNATVISLECSDARAGHVTLGTGPVLRVGDLTTTFDPLTLTWMANVAGDLAAEDRRFLWQRRLMPGGTCEATPFVLMGYATGALCVGLANYHNMGPRNQIAAEGIDQVDFEHEVRWLTALVERAAERPAANRKLIKRINGRFKELKSLLRSPVQ